MTDVGSPRKPRPIQRGGWPRGRRTSRRTRRSSIVGAARTEFGIVPEFPMVRGACSSPERCTMLRISMRNRKARRRGLRPGLEGLEGRVRLSTFNVNTTLDSVATNLKTGKDASGHISLRSAIMAADAQGGTNKIIVPAGTYTLTPRQQLNNGTAGELDINANVTIQGRGAGQTIIDGNNLGSGHRGPRRQRVDHGGDDPARPRHG